MRTLGFLFNSKVTIITIFIYLNATISLQWMLSLLFLDSDSDCLAVRILSSHQLGTNAPCGHPFHSHWALMLLTRLTLHMDTHFTVLRVLIFTIFKPSLKFHLFFKKANNLSLRIYQLLGHGFMIAWYELWSVMGRNWIINYSVFWGGEVVLRFVHLFYRAKE